MQQQRLTVDWFELFQTGGKQWQRPCATIFCNAPIWPEDGGQGVRDHLQITRTQTFVNNVCIVE